MRRKSDRSSDPSDSSDNPVSFTSRVRSFFNKRASHHHSSRTLNELIPSSTVQTSSSRAGKILTVFAAHEKMHFLEKDSGHCVFIKKLDFLSEFPYEVAFLILSFLDAKSLVRCAQVSKVWSLVLKDDRLWQRIYLSSPNYNLRIPDPRYKSNPTTVLFDQEDLFMPSNQLVPDWKSRIPKEFPGFRTLFITRKMLADRWRKGHLQPRFLPGHSDSVYCVQFDREKIITGSRDHSIKVWDPNTGNCLKAMVCHEASVLCLRYVGDYMVTGSSDCTAAIWKLPDFTLVKRLVGHTAGVLDVCINRQVVITCSKDTTIRIWNLLDGELLQVLQGHRGPVNAIQMVDNLLVSASGDGLAKVWNVKTGTHLRDLIGHSRGLACIRFDGNVAVSGSNDRTIKVWDVHSGACVATLVGHASLVRSLCFNNEWIVSGSYDQTIKVWDRKTNKVALDLRNGHTSWVFDVQFDSTKIVSVGQDERIVVWDFSYNLDVTFIG